MTYPPNHPPLILSLSKDPTLANAGAHSSTSTCSILSR